jgi:hypothetical protein
VAEEQWRPIIGYEDAYEVSDRGRVRSIARTVQRGRYSHRVQERILAAATQRRTGLLQVVLSCEKPATDEMRAGEKPAKTPHAKVFDGARVAAPVWPKNRNVKRAGAEWASVGGRWSAVRSVPSSVVSVSVAEVSVAAETLQFHGQGWPGT